MSTKYRRGDLIQNRKGRTGVVVGDSGGMDVRVRYDDGSKDTWVQRQNIAPLVSEVDDANEPGEQEW